MNNADWLILNIDDQQAIRYAKTRALQRAGFKVIEAASGHDGLACVEEHAPALVMCDVKMPDMSGLEVCRVIKTKHPGTLVLQVSASFVTAQDRATGLDHGADSYLTEPVEPEELIAAVRALLRMKQAESELRYAKERQEFIFSLAEKQRALDAPEAIMEMTAEAIGRRLQANRVGFYRVDGEALTFGTCWVDGRLWPRVGRLTLIEAGDDVINGSRSGVTFAIDDIDQDARITEAARREVGAKAAISVPRLRAGRWDGGLYVNQAAPRAWTPDEVGFVEEIAKLSWVSIDRAQAVADLQALNASLEREVEERTHALLKSEEQLRQAQKMEAVGQLTGGLAHDFNNLLTGIVGGIHVVRRRIARGQLDDVDRFMDAVVASAHRAAALTHRLLAFSRRQSLDFKPVDVNALIESMIALLRRTLGESVKLRLSLGSNIWMADTDANQLETALLNLLINARDAMPDGGEVIVQTSNTRWREEGSTDPREYVVLDVTDTGVGMSPQIVEKAFDPFFTTKPIGQGTGLGLSMVYGFLRQSRGHVRIISEVDQGTTVRLYFPRHSGEPEAAQQSLPREDQGAHGEVVLLAEDDPSVRLIVTEVLNDLGYGALVATDGDQAVEILNTPTRVDLLLTDVGLPGTNGRQVAEIGRRTRPGLKVLFITGYAEAASVRGGFLGPGMDLISKPFDLDVLAAKIREVIER